jgi:para-nitrobenzyl esterase
MAEKENPIVQTKSGKLRGIYEDGLLVFKGIPYAEPPVGKLRWMPPQPVKPWSGTRPADKFGPIAPQDVMTASAIPGRKPSEEPQSEDCLFLNVWTPAADKSKRAVMVWIHGGAFVHGSGSSPMNPGKTLPLRGRIVLVTINYRLGPLGFLHLKQVTNGKIPSSGNEGFLDQLAALRWVRDNIAAFGGDPDNITVFGESSGAESIGGLLAMPEKKGLFQKAILQSGASKCQPADRATAGAERLLGKLGLTGKDVEALRALTPQALLAALRGLAAPPPGVSAGAAIGPVLDSEVLKNVPLDAFEQGSAKDIIVLAGSNLEEGKLFALMTGPGVQKIDEAEMVRRVQRLVPKPYTAGVIEKYRLALAKRDLPVTPYEIYAAIQGDQHFRMPNIRLCEIQERLGTPSYGYVFNWKSAAPGFGACHALDVGFIFGNLTPEFHGTGPTAQSLAEGMQDAWITFAETGNPSCPGIGAWPRYGKDRKMMVLGEHSHVETAPYEGERAAWDGMPNKLLG